VVRAVGRWTGAARPPRDRFATPTTWPTFCSRPMRCGASTLLARVAPPEARPIIPALRRPKPHRGGRAEPVPRDLGGRGRRQRAAQRTTSDPRREARRARRIPRCISPRPPPDTPGSTVNSHRWLRHRREYPSHPLRPQHRLEGMVVSETPTFRWHAVHDFRALDHLRGVVRNRLSTRNGSRADRTLTPCAGPLFAAWTEPAETVIDQIQRRADRRRLDDRSSSRIGG